MVTGQSTTGTGVVTEFASNFTDLLRAQSGRINSKIKAGKDLCFSQLRKQALDLGANAVIATHIDCGGKGMLMVCMAGTAIILNNPEVLGEERASNLRSLSQLNNRLNHILDLEINANEEGEQVRF